MVHLFRQLLRLTEPTRSESKVSYNEADSILRMEQPEVQLDDRVVPQKKNSLSMTLLPAQESIFKNLTALSLSKSDTVNDGDRVEPSLVDGNKTPRWTSRGRKVSHRRSLRISWNETDSKYWCLLDGSLPAPRQIPRMESGNSQMANGKPFQLYTTIRYDTRANQYNVIHPAASPVMACIHATPREEYAVGILEVQVAFEK